jgi:hypothetical protein
MTADYVPRLRELMDLLPASLNQGRQNHARVTACHRVEIFRDGKTTALSQRDVDIIFAALCQHEVLGISGMHEDAEAERERCIDIANAVRRSMRNGGARNACAEIARRIIDAD